MPRQVELAPERAEYVAIAVSTLFPSTVTGFALHLRNEVDGRIQLYRGSDYPITDDDIQKLHDNGVTELYVTANAYHRYQHYLRDNLSRALEDEGVPARARFQMLNEVVKDVLSEAFASRSVDKTLEKVASAAQDIARLFSRGDVPLRSVYGLLCHDYQTFTHSANVAYYCVLLAKMLGYKDEVDLEALATGGLLHDIGKLSIPTYLLNKRGQFTDAERDIFNRHPTHGFLDVCHREDLSFGQLMMIYQHHERLDGSGFPVGCVGEEIHSWARICAVADTFDDLTGTRPYRPGMIVSDALLSMERQAGTRFDRKMIRCWTLAMINN